MPPTDGPTTKERRFVEEYCVDWNGTQAAIRAGYSPRNAGKIAYDLLRKPRVTDAIAERLNILTVAADVDALRIIRELQCIGHFNIQDILIAVQGGGIEDLIDADRDVTAAVSEITIREIPESERGPEQRIVKLKFHPKIEALSKLAQIKGMLKDRLEVTGAGGERLLEPKINLADLTDDELSTLDELLRRAESRRGSEGAGPPAP